MSESPALAFPGRRDDPALIEPALRQALERAAAGLVRGNSLGATALLEDALALTDEADVPGWTLSHAAGDPASSGQVAVIQRDGERVAIVVGRSDAGSVKAFCERSSGGETSLSPGALVDAAVRDFAPIGVRLTTTARVLRLWRRAREG